MPMKKLVIYDVYVPKTPQHGSWCAGITARTESGSQASWSGGKQTYEGKSARLVPGQEPGKPPRPAMLVLKDVYQGHSIEFFLAIDDDPEKAGTVHAADKITFRFPAGPNNPNGVTCGGYEDAHWKVVVQYYLADN